LRPPQGALVEQTSAQVLTIAGAKIRSVETFPSKEAALQAIGVAR
jgi:hypothetical protein